MTNRNIASDVMRSTLCKCHALARHNRANFATYRDALGFYMSHMVPRGNAQILDLLAMDARLESAFDAIRASFRREVATRRGERV